MDIQFAQKYETVTVRRQGQVIVIRPAFRELIGLRSLRRGAILGSSQGWESTAVIQRLLDVHESETGQRYCSCPAGLLPVVLRLLEKGGYRVHQQDTEVPCLASPDTQALQPLGQPDQVVLDYVRLRARGLIRIPSRGVSRIRLLRQVIAAWPHCTLLVLVSTIREASTLAQALRAVSPGIGISTSRRLLQHHEDHYRVIVATPGQLGMVGIRRRQIVVVMEARHVIRKNFVERLLDAHQARLYGFLECGVILPPFERDMLEAVFGFDGVTVPCHGGVERHVEFAQVRIEGGPRLPRGLSTIQLKRQGLWRHFLRNRLLASLAKGLCAGGENIAGRWRELAAKLGHPGPSRIAVLVENEEHAGYLTRRLRGWPILTNIPQFGTPGGIILTTTVDGKLNLANVDIVLRADGGVGLPPLPLPDCLTSSLPNRLILLDLDDHHHPTLRKRSQQRRIAYVRNGWTPVGVDRVEALVDWFIHIRPSFEEVLP